MALVVYQGEKSLNMDSSTESDIVTSPSGTSSKRFVGLTNQGATCYLNGLLQTLYMTPEFRYALYTWTYNPAHHPAPHLCIPLQLQKLFGKLQLSQERAIDTVGLTRSFGWEGFEVFQQQDVQELTRVLFDALEECFKDTPPSPTRQTNNNNDSSDADKLDAANEEDDAVATESTPSSPYTFRNMIDELYAGELIDYLRCMDVDYQSERVDKFLDFSLAIQTYVSSSPYSSPTPVPMHTLTECIEMFLRPELLDKENQYYVEKYDKKVDAIKGLKFGKLPYIMAVQLKRFVYDFTGPNIVQKKLNDEVRFPFFLDMNKYVAKKRAAGLGSKKRRREGGGGEAQDGPEEEGDEEDVLIDNEDFEVFLREQMEKLRGDNNKEQPELHTSSSVAAVAGDEDIDWNGAKTSAAAVEIAVGTDDDFGYADVPPLVTVTGEEVGGYTKGGVSGDEAAVERLEDILYTPQEVEELIRVRGEWVYELYAVLVHSGGVGGGHYYAYIKDLEGGGGWYNFNDSSVTPIDISVVKSAWGKGAGGGGGGIGSYPPFRSSYNYYTGANAYMLMYRKVSTRNVSLVPLSLIPLYIKEEVAKEDAERKEREKKEAEARNRLLIKLSCKTSSIGDILISAQRDWTYEAFLEEVRKKVEGTSEKKVEDASNDANATNDANGTTNEANSPTPLTSFTIREYNSYSRTVTGTYSYLAHGNKSLKDLGWSDYKTYLLEVKGAGGAAGDGADDGDDDAAGNEWAEGSFNVNVEVFDGLPGGGGKFREPPLSIRLARGSTLLDLKVKVQKKVGGLKDVKELRLLKIFSVGYTDGRWEVLGGVGAGSGGAGGGAGGWRGEGDDTRRLREELGVYDGMKVYMERYSEEEDIDENNAVPVGRAGFSPAFTCFIEQKNRLELKIIPPTPSASTPPIPPIGPSYQPSSSSAHSLPALPTPPSTPYSPYSATPSATLTLMADARWGVGRLRDEVSKLLGISPTTCRIFKFSLNGMELKGGEAGTPGATLSSLCVYNGITLHIKKGRVMPPNLYRARVCVFTPEGVLAGLVGGSTLPEVDIDDLIAAGEGEGVFYPTSTPSIATSSSMTFSTPAASPPPVPTTATAATVMDGLAVGLPPLVRPTPLMEVVGVEDEEDDSRGITPTLVDVRIEDTASLGAMEGKEIEPSEFGLLMVRNTVTASNFSYLSSPAGEDAGDSAKTATADGFDDDEDAEKGEGFVEITPSTTLAELRTMVGQVLVKGGLLPPSHPFTHLRLWERLGGGLGKVLRGEGRFLGHGSAGNMGQGLGLYLSDHTEIAVQILPYLPPTDTNDNESAPLAVEPQEDHEEVMLVYIQRFIRSSWSLSPRLEVLIKTNSSIKRVGGGLATLFSLSSPADMRVLLIPRGGEVYVHDLPLPTPAGVYRGWIDPKVGLGIGYGTSIGVGGILREGDLLLVQDLSETLPPLSVADLQSIQIVRAASGAGSSAYSYKGIGVGDDDAVVGTIGPSPLKLYGSEGGVSKRGAGGIKIRLHKKETQSTEGSVEGAGDGADAAVAGEGESDVTPLKGDDGEFAKQGGYALFDGML